MTKATVTHSLDGVPDELKAIDQWLVCNNVKVPINARTGGPGSTTNPATWSSSEKAREAVLSGKYKYVGFVFTESDPYTGIDLDGVRNPETGEIKPEAQEIINLLDSYTEVSQSGKGIHILIRGKKPGGRCRVGDTEIYDQGRYFALTGNIIGGHTTIEDRQEQLDTLYAETFGEGAKPVSENGYDISGLVFDGSANPPLVKFKKKLKGDVFTETWEFRRTDLKDTSLSGHALSLASQVKDWPDQEILNLIIAFYRKWGENKKVIDKPLRPDIIKGILSKIRHTDVQKELPFEVERVIQYGEEEAEYTIVIKGGECIDMGDTAAFLSPKRARQRLFEKGYFLSPKAMKNWPLIIETLMPLIRIEALPSRLEETEQWLRSFLATRTNILMIDPDNPKQPDSLSKALTTAGGAPIIRDKQGRIYLSSNSIIAHARMLFGGSLSLKALGIRLRKIGFKPVERASDYSGGKRSQVRMWMSPVGFLPPADANVETPAASLNLPGQKFYTIEEDDDVPPRKLGPVERAFQEINKEREYEKK